MPSRPVSPPKASADERNPESLEFHCCPEVAADHREISAGSVEAGVRAAGVLPVIALSTADDSVPVARALAAGGLAAVEITFRTEAAADAIAAIRAAMPDLLVVAGTVQRTSQVDAAIASGAQLIVTPGFNPVVVDYCLERGLPVMPGVATPSDVEQALLRELRLLALARHGSVPRPGRTSANAANGD